MTVDVEGLKELDRQMRRIKEDLPVKLGAALFQEGEAIMNISKVSFVPVDLGTLRSSGFVEPPKIKQSEITVTLGYGGAAKEYALRVHESPENWNWNVKGTGPKYLTKPANMRAPSLARNIARRLSIG